MELSRGAVLAHIQFHRRERFCGLSDSLKASDFGNAVKRGAKERGPEAIMADEKSSQTSPGDREGVAAELGGTLINEKLYRRPARAPDYEAEGRALEATQVGREGLERQVREQTGELEEAARALRSNEAQLQTLFDEAPLGIYLVDADFRIRRVNPAALPIFGDIPDLIGRDFDEVIHILWQQAYADELVERFRHTLETGESYFSIERMEQRRDSGVTEYYEWQINRITLPEGGYGVVCYFRDVSAPVLARKAVAESEENYRTLFEAIDEGFCTVEVLFDENERPVDYRFLQVNPSFERQTGIVNAVGKRMREIAPRHEEHWFETYGRVALTGEPVRFENEAAQLGRWYDVYAFRVGDPRLGRVGILFKDITGRRRAEGRLRASEERLRLLVESAVDYAIFTLTPDSRVSYWNAGAERVFGYAEEEILGRSGAILFTPEDRERGVPEQERRTAEAEGRASDERWHVSKNGTRFYCSGVMTALRHGGELQGFAKIARDLTSRKELEDALRRAHDELEARVEEGTAELQGLTGKLLNEVKERAAAEGRVRELLRRLVTVQEEERRRISRELHDTLGQQLAALSLSIDLIKGESEGRARLLEHLGRTRGIFDRLNSDVDFLAWELRPAALDEIGLDAALRSFVREWGGHFQIEADYRGFGPDAPRLAPEVETNLYRILQEALQNVHKHAGATHVSVILEQRDGRVALIVEDDGRGYDPEAEVAAGSNKGMGVVNMRERAALVGGELEVESTPGAGVTIFVRLPFKPEPPRGKGLLP
jgi:PAS domain S-box-containing protein